VEHAPDDRVSGSSARDPIAIVEVVGGGVIAPSTNRGGARRGVRVEVRTVGCRSVFARGDASTDGRPSPVSTDPWNVSVEPRRGHGGIRSRRVDDRRAARRERGSLDSRTGLDRGALLQVSVDKTGLGRLAEPVSTASRSNKGTLSGTRSTLASGGCDRASSLGAAETGADRLPQ
jgi:hypothetical protein